MWYDSTCHQLSKMAYYRFGGECLCYSLAQHTEIEVKLKLTHFYFDCFVIDVNQNCLISFVGEFLEQNSLIKLCTILKQNHYLN